MRERACGIFVTDAYSAPRISRNAFLHCSPEKRTVLLDAQRALAESCPMMHRSATVPGKVAFLREVWEKSEAVFEAVDKEGTKAALCRALSAISFFGAGREESRRTRKCHLCAFQCDV